MVRFFQEKWLSFVQMGVLALAGLLIVGIAAPQMARAEMVVERNKILLGNDYSVFSLKPGPGQRKRCRTACAKDGRCQAWTFVRPGADGFAQCRLKQDITRGISNKCCVSGFKKFDFRKIGGDKRRKKRVAFCDSWAEQAVKLNEDNQTNRCGYRGRAWHSDTSRHFRRCMQMGPKVRKSERAGQLNAVKVCVAELGLGKRARCDHYARVAVTQNSSRLKGACGTDESGRWSAQYKGHYSWCLKAKKQVAYDEQSAREKNLQRCFAFDRNRSGPCHDYAQGAILHFRKNVEKGCDLHGPRWHNNYRRHVSICRKMSPKQRRREMSKRKLTLKTCRLFGKVRIKWR